MLARFRASFERIRNSGKKCKKRIFQRTHRHNVENCIYTKQTVDPVVRRLLEDMK
jgi:hypothetical protein